MIPRTTTTWQHPEWKILLREAITDPHELLALLELDPQLIIDSEPAVRQFPLRVPRGFVARMQKGNPHDPLLKQVLPLAEERAMVPGYTKDPVGDLAANAIPGLLHKYHGRVLLTLSGACAVNCRYCFRRHYPYHENTPGKKGLGKIIDYILHDPSIHEVILSGGDPLALDDDYLLEIIERFEKIPHLQRLRIHSRLPVVLPQRITEQFVQRFSASRLQAILVIHCNHPNEIDHTVRSAMCKLKDAGITLLNQAVLLKKINDSYQAITELCEKLFNCGVIPYYLHLLDKVEGAAHFAVEKNQALQIMQQVQSRLPGYMVPKLVEEIAGHPFKVLVK